MSELIYLDNQATTRVDPRVVDAMLPLFDLEYGNAGSLVHRFGEAARRVSGEAREQIAGAIGATADELVITSGATESNNLALQGVAKHPRQTRRRLVSLVTEHYAILDPLRRLQDEGFDIVLVPVKSFHEPDCGVVELDRLRDVVDETTALVTVMLANNEIGTLQPLQAIAEIAHEYGALCHTDATQAVGKLAVDVRKLGVDMMSFSAHKLHGPKGVGALYVHRGRPRVRLQAQILGGGQEQGRRSGTLNVPGLVGFAKAVELALADLEGESQRIRALRDRLWIGLQEHVPGIGLNGPRLDDPQLRLPGNLNCRFPGVDGEALMLALPNLALSSGAACTSTHPEPSHVLRAIGLSDDEIRSSLRFGLSRFTTAEEIEKTIEWLAAAVNRLQSLGTSFP